MQNNISAPVSKGFFGDLFLAFGSIFIGLYFADHNASDSVYSQTFIVKLGVYFIFAILGLLFTRSWQNVWRWTSSDDLWRVFQTIIFAAIGYSIIAYFYIKSFTLQQPLLVSFTMASTMMGGRGFARLISSGGDLMALSALFRPIANNAFPAIVIGPIDVVTHSLHEFRKVGPLPFRPIAIVSTAGNHIGKVFAGAKVFDGTQISKVLPKLVNDGLSKFEEIRIILVGENHSNEVKQAALDIVSQTNAKLSRLPEIGSKDLTYVNPQDVLGRKLHIIDDSCLISLLRHKTVLVTGAGGTIGSELSRQIAKFQPGHLILVDNSENNLYNINQNLSEDYPSLKITLRLADVREEQQIQELFARFLPQIVIHAAANKHVPMLELHPREAIRVNLGGTKVVADAAYKYKSEIFILISTDKAVNPTNIMGAAKRCAELYVRHCFEKSGGKFYSVRFGNVLGSSGSVMPLFERQISKMGPVTITHRDMTRWFMTVEEAVALVLQGAALGGGAIKDSNGEKSKLENPLLVLDMGDPIRIVDFAEAMIRLRGYEPYKDIQIEFSGVRPGEKLHEEIFYVTEHVENSAVKGIYCARPLQDLPEDLEEMVEKIIALGVKNKIHEALQAIQEIVPEAHLK